MNKTRTITTKLTMVAFLFAMVLLMMPMNTFAAKKPGQAKNIEEVKATDNSVTIKFKKVSGAKKYQVQVHEATRSRKVTSTTTEYGNKRYKYNFTWKSKNKVVKKAETKKNTCTIKGLQSGKSYAIKVRACNGKNYGKWTTQYIWTTYEGIRSPGKSAATGKNLKKQYEKWKKQYVDSAKKEQKDRGKAGVCFDPALRIKCMERVHENIQNPGQYSMDEVYETYKRGYGTDLEIYHLCMDICKEVGVKYKLRKVLLDYEDYISYELLIDYEDVNPNDMGQGLILRVSPNSIIKQVWQGEAYDIVVLE